MCVAVVFSGAIHGKAAPEDPALPSFPSAIRYDLREDPGDLSSAVIWTIELGIQAEQADGSYVGWLIHSVTISGIDQDGQPTNVWIDASPGLSPSGGLWWVEHADPDNPQRSEFAMPPHLQGTASAEDPIDEDLDYDFEGKTYTPPAPPEEPPYEVTAALDYTFTPVGSGAPIASGEDEPVEVPPEELPGNGS